jgi:hypothetical protein
MPAKGFARTWTLGALVSLAALGCGSVTPIAPDGGGGAGAAGQGGAGHAGATGSAGHGGAGGGAGSAGHGGSGGAGQGGASGSAGQGGAGGASNPCRGLTEMQCSATPGCMAGRCPGCNGGSIYPGCYQPSSESAPPCPGVACELPCGTLNETQCLARTDCRADYCNACQGKTFGACANPNDPLPQCPALKCPAPCSSVTTLADCEARTDCHSVFVDPGTCGCAVSGCCAHFSSCADGDKAMCTGMPLCRAVTPFCEAPYVVSYTATCYEGCVNKKDCGP